MNTRFATMSAAASQPTQAVTATVTSYPLSTAMIVFGAGLGLGVWAGTVIADAALARPSRPVEAFGYKMLDRLSAMLPDVASSFTPR